jgi:hypothetical protein
LSRFRFFVVQQVLQATVRRVSATMSDKTGQGPAEDGSSPEHGGATLFVDYLETK